MAIAPGAVTAIATGISVSATVNKPAGAVDGNYVFVLIDYNDPGGANTVSPPDGTWTLSIGPVRESAGGTMHYIFGKKLSGDPASWTFTGPNTSWATCAISYTGNGLTIDVSGSGNCGTLGSANFVAGAVTTTQPNTTVLYMIQIPQNITWTAAAGTTERLDESTATFGWGNTVDDKTQAGVGTTGTATIVGSATAAANNVAAYFTIALYETGGPPATSFLRRAFVPQQTGPRALIPQQPGDLTAQNFSYREPLPGAHTVFHPTPQMLGPRAFRPQSQYDPRVEVAPVAYQPPLPGAETPYHPTPHMLGPRGFRPQRYDPYTPDATTIFNTIVLPAGDSGPVSVPLWTKGLYKPLNYKPLRYAPLRFKPPRYRKPF